MLSIGMVLGHLFVQTALTADALKTETKHSIGSAKRPREDVLRRKRFSALYMHEASMFHEIMKKR